MVILHTETLKGWGGQQNRVLAESVGLIKRGHHVIIACRKGSVLSEKAKQAGVKVYEVNFVKTAHLSTVPQLIKIIKSEGVDIVSTHSSVDSWAGAMAALLSRRILIRFRHNLFILGRDPLTKFIYTVPDSIIAISEAVRDVLISCGKKKEHLTTIHSAVNLQKFDPEADDIRDELKIPRDAIILGNTSTFDTVKGQKYLLQAINIIAKEIPCYLLFAGRLEEPDKSRYLSYVEEGLRDKVILLGHRDDIPEVLKTIDIFTYPSYLEALGTALIEAMAMGKTVAVSDIPSFKYFVEDNVNGVYFNTKDPQDLAKNVMPLMKDKERRKRLGENARVAALEKFSEERMIDLTEAHYREVMNAK